MQICMLRTIQKGQLHLKSSIVRVQKIYYNNIPGNNGSHESGNLLQGLILKDEHVLWYM